MSLPPDPLDVALLAAVEAAHLLVEGFTGGEGGTPRPRDAALLGRHQEAASKDTAIDLVTDYDRRAEALIVSRIRTAFPADTIVAEEGALGGNGSAHTRWLIDPLDGTTNFAHG